MISNHAQFLDAIRDKQLVRAVFYSRPDAGTVDRECAPLDYGPDHEGRGGLNCYWMWDSTATAGPNPLALVPDQIVSVNVLGKFFDPRKLPLGDRSWCVPRNWGAPAPSPPPVSPPQR